jgi:membrane associated rhomboid family serine protease
MVGVWQFYGITPPLAEFLTCATSFAAEMHAAGLKTGAESGSVTSRNNTMKGTMTIMTHTMANLTDSIL